MLYILCAAFSHHFYYKANVQLIAIYTSSFITWTNYFSRYIPPTFNVCWGLKHVRIELKMNYVVKKLYDTFFWKDYHKSYHKLFASSTFFLINWHFYIFWNEKGKIIENGKKIKANSQEHTISNKTRSIGFKTSP